MKTFFILSLVFGMCLSGLAQKRFTTQVVHVMPRSSLVLKGHSNIKDFNCIFNTALLDSEKKIKVTSEAGAIYFGNALLRLKSDGFECGNRGINRDFRSLVQSEEYPEIVLELKKVKLEENGLALAYLQIMIAGKKKSYDLAVQIADSESLHIQGDLRLNIQDFDLEPPKKLLGLIMIKEEIEISFSLFIKTGQEAFSISGH